MRHQLGTGLFIAFATGFLSPSLFAFTTGFFDFADSIQLVDRVVKRNS